MRFSRSTSIQSVDYSGTSMSNAPLIYADFVSLICADQRESASRRQRKSAVNPDLKSHYESHPCSGPLDRVNSLLRDAGVIIPLLMFIDSHAHIEGKEFDADREAVIQRALEAGVEIIVCVGDGEVAADSHTAAFRIAERYPF